MPLNVQEKSDILELVARYNFAIDHRQAEDWADTFTEDGVFRVAGAVRAQGRAGLVALIHRRIAEGVTMRHWVNNAIIEGDGSEARLRAYLAVYNTTHGVAAPFLLAEYDDRLVKVDGRWKFKLRDVTVVAGKSTPTPA